MVKKKIVDSKKSTVPEKSTKNLTKKEVDEMEIKRKVAEAEIKAKKEAEKKATANITTLVSDTLKKMFPNGQDVTKSTETKVIETKTKKTKKEIDKERMSPDEYYRVYVLGNEK